MKQLEPLAEKFRDGSEQYKRYVQLRHYSLQEVKYEDFTIFRILGKGAFGQVNEKYKKENLFFAPLPFFIFIFIFFFFFIYQVSD